MNVIKAALSIIAALSAALIAYSAFFVRGDLGGVMAYLRARGALRRLRESGTPEQVAQGQAQLQALGQQVGDPALAAQLIPLALTVGLLVGALVWWAFSRRQSGTPRTDIQERMVYRLAHRKGGRFTLDDLRAASPLTDEQARAVTARLLDLGRLTRDGDTFRLP
ncbi:hypothetical protein [Deinococcus aquaticus]|uniref:MarR family transcriptional regulator n=1 Tax=Deinococcus aquaticus TaxID=328692 RepID=A0ABY7UYA7_9DEIO|nr:hypothetical protein [Deinococcus aquaticus]WDA57901.1 hypothetical protein M8445_11135 [Deinococcus aquaticus]